MAGSLKNSPLGCLLTLSGGLQRCLLEVLPKVKQHLVLTARCIFPLHL
ncbi:hypothetical protein [Photorhabdus heterorhabditis]|nr:hypothetical protein [Photorhabdus heterorhabditis]